MHVLVVSAQNKGLILSLYYSIIYYKRTSSRNLVGYAANVTDVPMWRKDGLRMWVCKEGRKLDDFNKDEDGSYETLALPPSETRNAVLGNLFIREHEFHDLQTTICGCCFIYYIRGCSWSYSIEYYLSVHYVLPVILLNPILLKQAQMTRPAVGNHAAGVTGHTGMWRRIRERAEVRKRLGRESFDYDNKRYNPNEPLNYTFSEAWKCNFPLL